MEGQVPWISNKKPEQKKDPTITAAATPAPPPPSPPPMYVIAAVIIDLASLMQDLSFASITEILDEIACATKLPFTTILYSGTTIILVKDCRFLHTYTTKDPVNVLTANHGILQTIGHRTCISWFTIGQYHFRKLYVIEFNFILFTPSPSVITPILELTAFMNVPFSLDLWHMHKGYYKLGPE
ncbi:hypothetical protein BDR03DRAFT_1013015 [Suillus americanus]|nr:hypothetical protein BDR03DRAFT_1013015 [Suillus americanus]